MEETHWEDGTDRHLVEGPRREERMVGTAQTDTSHETVPCTCAFQLTKFVMIQTHNFNFFLVIFRGVYLFKGKAGDTPTDHKFYRNLYPQIIEDIEVRLGLPLIDPILTLLNTLTIMSIYNPFCQYLEWKSHCFELSFSTNKSVEIVYIVAYFCPLLAR